MLSLLLDITLVNHTNNKQPASCVIGFYWGDSGVMIIKLDNKTVDICNTFADACVDTNRYSYRSQHNKQKIRQDIFVGKMGEMAVHKFITDLGISCTLPDTNIYKGRQKRHDADLTANGLPIAIKTQQLLSAQKYGVSFMIETSSLEKHNNQLFVTCLQLSEDEYLIHNIATFDEIKRNLSKPRLEYLKTKSAIYINDIFKQRLLSHMPQPDQSGTDTLVLGG